MSDYISREALIGNVEKHYCAPCKETGGDLGGDWCRCCVINSVLEMVRGIPAADVEPVRHVAPIDCGIDEYYGGWVRCPNCDFDLNTSVAKFCGGCGAKMDLEDDHEN